jgi:hypothetical protein
MTSINSSIPIISINNEIEKYSLKDDDYTSKYLGTLNRGQNWDLNNFKTIINWLNIANLYILLLSQTVEYYTNQINKVTIWCLIVSTLSSTISLSQFSVSDSQYPNTALVLKFIFTFTSILTTILTGYLKISKAKDNLDKSLEYHNRWMVFATELSSQLQLPINIRLNATKIIISSKDTFKHLFNTRINFPGNVKDKVSDLLLSDAIRLSTFKNHIEKDMSNNLFNFKCKEYFFKSNRENLDIKYIYDAQRLNLYFIFKDLIYNEIKNFEQFIISSDKKFINKKLKFTMTPSRIFINLIDITNNQFEKNNKNNNVEINNPLRDFNSIYNNLNDITSNTPKNKQITINLENQIIEDDTDESIILSDSDNNFTDDEITDINENNNIVNNELEVVISKYDENKTNINPIDKLNNEILKSENNINLDSNSNNSSDSNNNLDSEKI